MAEVCDAARVYLGKHFCDHPEGGSVRDEDLIQYTLHSLNLQMLKVNHAYLNALSHSYLYSAQTSIKGGANSRYVDLSGIHASMWRV